MGQNFLQRFFGIGKVPEQALSAIEHEGVVMLEEGVSGSVTFRSFRAPGKFFFRKRTWFTGSLVITEKRFAAFTYSRPIVNVTFDHERFRDLHCSLKDEKTLSVRFDAAAFNEKQSGEIECRFSTPDARQFLEQIETRTA